MSFFVGWSYYSIVWGGVQKAVSCYKHLMEKAGIGTDYDIVLLIYLMYNKSVFCWFLTT